MNLQFKKGSEIEAIALTIIEEKEKQHNRAKQIIEDITGTRITCALGYSCTPTTNYIFDYRALLSVESINGYTRSLDSDLQYINKRTKVFRELKKAFSKERFGISNIPLEPYGIFTSEAGWRNTDEISDLRFYPWKIGIGNDGHVLMAIHPRIKDLIDWGKCNNQYILNE
jgi:hypothetical protein